MEPASYDGTRLRVIPFNLPPVSLGGGWWKFEWIIEHDPQRGKLIDFHLVTPPAELSESSLVMSIVERDDRTLQLELIARSGSLESIQIGYLSLVMQEIEKHAGTIRINGLDEHPLLKASAPGRA